MGIFQQRPSRESDKSHCQFGKGLLREILKLWIKSRTIERRSLSAFSKEDSSFIPIDHSGGIPVLAVHMLRSSIVSIRESQGSKDCHPRTPRYTSFLQ